MNARIEIADYGDTIRVSIVLDEWNEQEYNAMCPNQHERARLEAQARGWVVFDPDDGTGDIVVAPADGEWQGGLIEGWETPIPSQYLA